jgi:hypothetical protein
MIRPTLQHYFEQFIRPRLRDLAARGASGRELTEQLRAIAADYDYFCLATTLDLNTSRVPGPSAAAAPAPWRDVDGARFVGKGRKA